VQINSEGPFEIKYVNPADHPSVLEGRKPDERFWPLGDRQLSAMDMQKRTFTLHECRICPVL
jgi:hypothetical protein